MTGNGLAVLKTRVAGRHAILSIAFLLLYFLLNRPEVIMVSKLGFTVWFPATGLILAIMLGISPWYFLLAVFADALAGNVLYHQPPFSWSETVGPFLGAGSYGVAAWLLRGPLKIDAELRKRRDVVLYVAVGLGAAVFATATGVASLAADHTILWSEYWHSAVGWYVGDAVGLVGFAPFLLIHVLPWVRRVLLPAQAVPQENDDRRKAKKEQTRFTNVLEWIGQIASIVLVLWLLFGGAAGNRSVYYLAFIPIVWIAMRQGIQRVVTGLLIFDFGIVVALKLYPVAQESLSNIGLLMLAASGTGLIVGAAVTERHRIAKQLGERTRFLNSLIENNPLGIVVLDRAARVQLCNAAFTNLFLFKQEEIVGNSLEPLISLTDEAKPAEDLSPSPIPGQSLHQTVSKKRKDGRKLDLEVHTVSIELDGRMEGAYAIYKDVSEQVKAAVQAKEHAESLDRLVYELQLRTMEMTLLNDMGDLLQCSASSVEAYGVVGQFASRILRASSAGGLFVFKSSRNLLEMAAPWGESLVSKLLFAPDACWALRLGKPHWSEHPGGVVICPHLEDPKEVSCLCVPLVAQGDTLGVLQIQYDRSGSNTGAEPSETMHDSQQRLAVAMGGRVALSLAGLLLRETLRDQSIRDSLTGLFNRRFMGEALGRELQRAKRRNHSVVVVFLDLDHFKRFNDVYGHDAGDTVLRAMAKLFQQHFRGDDVICRYGGEEFAIILPESGGEDAAKRVEELRETARGLKITYQEQVLETVTFSIGLAAYPRNASSGEELMRKADECLYQSKARGRDCLTIASSAGV
jgi:diguanylate cyclase (GGDEF)-like protein/PAS domain S-box-containing protein